MKLDWPFMIESEHSCNGGEIISIRVATWTKLIRASVVIKYQILRN